MNSISFFSNQTSFRLSSLAQEQVSLWLKKIATLENFEFEQINYVFSNDEFVLNLNQKYLGHDYYTDILTFPLDDDARNAEIYISITRVIANADKYQVSFKKELMRVLAHGLLHLIGFDDHTDLERKNMRKIEELYILQPETQEIIIQSSL